MTTASIRDGGSPVNIADPDRRTASKKCYKAYREQIEHEDDLIGMRNGWLIGGEAFLFAAYAALLVLPSNSEPDFAGPARQLFHELPWIGIGLAVLAFCAVGAALWRSSQLRHDFLKDHFVPEGFPPVISAGPRHVGHSVAAIVPLAMATAWIVVLVRR
jgi:hypothetical protein